MTYKNGDVYEGEYLSFNQGEEMRHGRGTLTEGNSKDIYEGDWKYDKKHGYGKKTFQDGQVREGSWLDEKLHGSSCKIINADGDIYEGEVCNDKMNGQGKFIFKDTGDTYEGSFKLDMKDGQGTYHWRNSGDIYEGAWKDDKKHGHGALTFKNVKVITGEWHDGKLSLANGMMVTYL